MTYFGRHFVPEDRVLVYHIDTEPLNLDPARCSDYIGQIVLQALYEPLLVRDSSTGRLIPGAAKHYEVSLNQLTYTFYLRESKWSDGTSVTASDFVFAFRRLAHPNVESPVGPLLDVILNGEQVLARVLPAEMLGVRELNELTLQIQLENPVNHFPSLLAGFNFSPVPHQLLGRYEDTWESHVTNGPFVLSERHTGTDLFLQPNPARSEPERGVRGLRFWVCKDLRQPLEAYAGGRSHVTCNTYFPFDRLTDLTQLQDLVKLPSGILFVLAGNRNACPLWADHRFRKALHYSLDRCGIAQSLYGGVIPWDHFVATGVAGDLFGTVSPAHNPRRARQLLQDVRRTQTDRDLPRLRILYADYYPNTEILRLVQAAWRQTLDVHVELEPVEFSEHVQRMAEGTYELSLVLLSPTYDDPSAFLAYFLPDLEDRSYRKLTDCLIEAQSGDAVTRRTAFSRADSLLRRVLPAIPLCSGQSIYLCKPEVRGYRVFPDGSVSFRGLRFELGGNHLEEDRP